MGAITHEELRAYLAANADGFDERFGVETEKMRVDINYGSIRSSTFDEVLDSVQIDPSRYVFVDIGSGKGKGVLLAATRPFRRIIGVELDAECCEIARKNVVAMGTHVPDMNRVEIECMDAFDWVAKKWPADRDVFVLMYLPFQGAGAPYLRFFMALSDAVTAAKGTVILGFVNPFGEIEELLDAVGFKKIGQNKGALGELESILFAWKTFSFGV